VGASFVLFSAAIGDAFGTDYAATNNGIHYTSKGWRRSLRLGAASWWSHGNWTRSSARRGVQPCRGVHRPLHSPTGNLSGHGAPTRHEMIRRLHRLADFIRDCCSEEHVSA